MRPDLLHYTNFNSRPRAGGDLAVIPAVLLVQFQFSPPRGGRLALRICHRAVHISIPAPARGATRSER